MNRYVLFENGKRIWDEDAPSLTAVFSELIEFIDIEFYEKVNKEFERKGKLPVTIKDAGKTYQLIEEKI